MLIASTQNDLGVALERLGKHDEAETLHRAALATASATPGAAPEGLMSARNNLAVLLVRKGELEEAEKYYRQALAQQRELLGPVHPSLANTLQNLGILMSNRDRKSVVKGKSVSEHVDIGGSRINKTKSKTLY